MQEQDPDIFQFKFYWSEGEEPGKKEKKKETKDTLKLLKQCDKVEDHECIFYRVIADARGGCKTASVTSSLKAGSS